MKFSLQPLGDFFTFQKGLGYLGKYLQPSKVALVGLNSFEGGGGYKFGGEKEYSGPFKVEHTATPGDLFISTTDITQDGRVLASPFIMPNLTDNYEAVIFSGDIVKATPVADGLLPEFVYNVLRVKAFRQKAAYASSGSTVRRIPIEVLERLEVPVPPKEIQATIARQIDLFDKTIETNSDISLRLEQIAQTIFKSWFVDFDPVHAKARGEQPVGMDAETASLFPDSFGESELGLIPEGWLASSVGESVNVTMGQSPPGTAYNEEGDGLPFFQGRTDFGERFPSRRVFSTQGNRLASSGDTLLSVRAPVGDLNQALETCILGRGLAALRHKSNSEAFTYCLAQALGPQLQRFNGEGSVFGAINRKDLQALRFVEPPAALVAKFEELTGPMNQQIRTLHVQSLSLVSLRDSLLPRLISGEIEIPSESLVG